MKKFFAILVSALMVFTMMTPVMAEENVYQVSNETYSTMQEAVDACQTDVECTILVKSSKVLNDDEYAIITSGKDITLDLNGNTLSISSNYATVNGSKSRFLTVESGAKLTIIGNGKLDFSLAGTSAFGALDNYGTLYLNGITYVGNTEANTIAFPNRSGATMVVENATIIGNTTSIRNFNGANLTINDGYFYSPWYPALDNDGYAVINGGTFENTSCSSCDNAHWGYTIRSGFDGSDENTELIFNDGEVIGVQGAISINNGKATINDGEFKTVACENHPQGETSFYALYVAGEFGKVKVEVNGGNFESYYKSTVLVGNMNDGGVKAESTLVINDGSFSINPKSNSTNKVINSEANGDPYIEGGSFSDDSAYNYLSSNDLALANVTRGSDTIYVVGSDSIQQAASKASEDTVIEISQGSVGLTKVPDGVTVSNKGDGEVTVNGTPVAKDEEVVAHTHDLQHVLAKPATYEADGNIEYWYCNKCKKYFNDEAATKEIAKDDITIAKLQEENKPEVEVPDTAVTYNYLIGTGILSACALTGVVILRKRYSK